MKRKQVGKWPGEGKAPTVREEEKKNTSGEQLDITVATSQ